MALAPIRMSAGLTHGQRMRLSDYYNTARSAYNMGKRAYDWYNTYDSPPRKKIKTTMTTLCNKLRPIHQTLSRAGPNKGRYTKYGQPASYRYLSSMPMRRARRGRRRRYKKYRSRYYRR